MRSPIARSTPLRLTLILGATLVVSLAISGTAAYFLVREELLARTDRGLQDTFAVIAQSYVESDPQDLIDLVSSHVLASANGSEIYLLADSSGSRVAGNIDAAALPTGYATRPSAQLGMAKNVENYRTLTGTVGPFTLTTGTTLQGVEDVSTIVVASLGWAIGGLVTIMLVIGGATAIGAQRRLDRIAETMGQIGRGDLAARIPRSGRNDDVDALVGSVNDALDRLAALVEGLRQVSVDIAHELKTPLNRLSISVATATEASERGEAALPYLEEAQNEVAQVISIFDAMLRIAQIESGARRAKFREFDLRPLVLNVGEAFEPVASEAGQSLVVKVEPDVPAILGDRELLTQAIVNLVENAIRHCDSETSVVIELSKSNGAAAIAVTDDGPGIPTSDQARVFDRLYRVEKSRTRPGHGLGLSLVKAVAELHGATITLSDNRPGLRVALIFPKAVA